VGDPSLPWCGSSRREGGVKHRHVRVAPEGRRTAVQVPAGAPLPDAGSDTMLNVHAVTPERWPDLEQLFGRRGACGGCWCMWFRLPRREYEAGRGEANRRALQSLVQSGRPPGLIGYADGVPVAWCSVAPRPEYRRLLASRTMQPIDDLPAWTIMCLFVAREHRRKRYSVEMIRAACEFARAGGATVVEAYPIRPKSDDVPAIFASQGTLAAFLEAGFAPVAEPSGGRVLVRWEAS
jgi:GNAT superfamily N-acetyltransferase